MDSSNKPGDTEHDLRTHLLALYGNSPYSLAPEDPMTARNTRSERFDARLSPADKRLLDRAAELTGRSLSEFVLGSAREAAQRTIERYEVMTLTDPRDQAAFVGALLNPPAPSRRLRQAMQRYRRLTAK